MRAAVLHAYGEPPQPGEFPEPHAGEGQVVVDVLAGGLNPVDLFIASGRFYGGAPPLPSVAGREGVGRLPDGTRVLFGQCVAPYGSFAERTLIDAAAAIPVPDTVPDELAVGLWTAGLAAIVPFERIAPLSGGERVLVLGASGAVGQLAVQVARLLGAGRVVAAARSPQGRKRALDLGADAAVAIEADSDLGAALLDACDGGFDVILDLLYGPPLLGALQAAAPWARVAQVGNAAAPEVTLPAAALRRANVSLIGYQGGLLQPGERVAAYLQLLDHATAGRLLLETERVPLARVEEAWRRQASSPGRKLVIVP
ncbi:MAG TPA: zinc-binding alcohol dehydrogenase family protein [Solirubrobacteraceae bacterium]|nr:zinc-binding alcohol dehydrogenase family protein [Solirubrobacteraceae bacterium]